MAFLLSIKDAIRPDIVVAMIGDDKTKNDNIDDSITAIEELLNNGESNIDFRAQDITNTVNLVYNSILNNTKVVPGLKNFTNFDTLNMPDIRSKVEKLNEDKKAISAQVANRIGIPQELFEGTSNRWEVISRSGRFLTLISSLLDDVSNCVKEIGLGRIKSKHKKLNVSMDDLELNLDSSNVVFNNNFNNRTSVVSEKFSKINSLVQDLAAIEESEFINGEEFLKFAENQLSVLDSGLSKIINREEDK